MEETSDVMMGERKFIRFQADRTVTVVDGAWEWAVAVTVGNGRDTTSGVFTVEEARGIIARIEKAIVAVAEAPSMDEMNSLEEFNTDPDADVE